MDDSLSPEEKKEKRLKEKEERQKNKKRVPIDCIRCHRGSRPIDRPQRRDQPKGRY